MAQYLLSVHTVEGEAREPRTDEQMQELMRNIGELEREMKSADALVTPVASRAPRPPASFRSPMERR